MDKVKSLKDTMLDLHGAQNRLTNMINGDLNGLQHFNTVDLATMAEVSKSLAAGVNYLEFMGKTLNEFEKRFQITLPAI